MLVGGMIDDKIDDEPDIHLMRRIDKSLKILHRSIERVDRLIVGHVILVIGGRYANGHEPNCRIAQIADIGQLLRNAVKVPYAVSVGIAERIHEHLVVVVILVVDDVLGQLPRTASGGGKQESPCQHDG